MRQRSGTAQTCLVFCRLERSPDPPRFEWVLAPLDKPRERTHGQGMFTRFLPVAVALAVTFHAAVVCGEDAALPVRHVLFFSKSAGFEHSVIKREGGKPSFVETLLTKVGPARGIEFTFSKDGSLFTPENIAKYDAFVFFTTGDLLTTNGDGNPAMTAEGKAALLDAIRHGKGFVGTHSTSDTFHTAGSPWVNNGQDADPFIAMLGGEFISHNQQQPGHVTCTDPKFPGMAAVAGGLDWTEEWYSLKNFAPDLHVLLVQHTGKMEGPAYQRPDYPGTWAHLYGEGRVFYTSLAHREDTWENPQFQAILFGGIRWATRDAEGDLTPNLTQVCPQASVNPPEPPKAK